MNKEKLAKAIRELASTTKSVVVMEPKDAMDAAELLNVLARILEGKPIDRAFGAPGDWGYGTPIGDALARK